MTTYGDGSTATASRIGSCELLVNGIPALILFDGGEERDRMVNVIRRQAVEDHLGAFQRLLRT